VSETELQTAERSLVQAKELIASQLRTIDELKRDGLDTAAATALLAMYEHDLKHAQLHVDRLT
jgi:hypothetical protein